MMTQTQRQIPRARSLLLLWLVPATAWGQPTVSETGAAQTQGPTTKTPATASTSATNSTGVSAGYSATPTSPILFRPLGNGAADANATLPSSSRPMLNPNASRDSFDLNAAGGEAIVRGSKGSYAITGESVRAVAVPEIHTVRRGDTLWDLCGHYLGNSWDWPRIWSYNPDIRNPNWIYPGDQIRMRSRDELSGNASFTRFGTPNANTTGGNDGAGSGLTASNTGAGGMGLVQPRMPRDTVFLRNEAYIEDPSKDVLGEVVGAKEEQMLLGQGNHVYIDVKPGTDLKVGQELSLFEQSRKPEAVEGARQPPGEVILIKGTVRVEDYNPKKHLARALILESADAVERGTKIGAVGRRYLVVAPKPSSVTVWARLLTGVYPHVYMGERQLVFIDRGSEDGLSSGNRLLVVRRGDAWRRSLETAATSARYRMRVDHPGNAEAEATQLKREEREFPEEIVGEIRVVHAHRWSSLAVVTSSQRELLAGDRAVARQGY